MAGNKKQAESTKRNHGEDFYARIGAKGGSTPTNKPRGLAAISPERRAEIARMGVEARQKHD